MQACLLSDGGTGQKFPPYVRKKKSALICLIRESKEVGDQSAAAPRSCVQGAVKRENTSQIRIFRLF